MAGNSSLQATPITSQIVINVTGGSCGGDVISITGNSVINNTGGIAGNLIFNYAGTGTIKIAGGSNAFYVLNAPLSPVTIRGGSDIYGAIIANTIDDSGGVNLHFDNAVTVSTSPATTTYSAETSSYSTLAFRSLPY
jgi:choice-of-anchor A domain-containing protein